MRALGQAGLPVPVAVDHNRHAVLMSLVDATLLAQVPPAEQKKPESMPRAALRPATLLTTRARTRGRHWPGCASGASAQVWQKAAPWQFDTNPKPRRLQSRTCHAEQLKS